MAFDSTKKITFPMGTPQSFVLSDWSPNQWGKMRYNTADGRFFDASPGLSNLLGEMNLAPNTEVTIVKQSNIGKDGTDYGKFYVNGQCMDDIKNGGVQPSVATPPTPSVAPQPSVNVAPMANVAVTLETINAKLDKVIKAIEENLPF